MKCTCHIYQALIAGVLSISVLLTSSGCAPSTAHFPTVEEMRSQTRTVDVVPGNSVPIIYFEPAYAKGKDAGAAKGAGLGALYGFVRSFEVSKAGLAAFILWPIVAPIYTFAGATAGADRGAKEAVPEEDVNAVQGLILENGSKNIQEIFGQNLLRAGKNMTDYRFRIAESGKAGLRTSSADLTVETEIRSVGFVDGKGQNPAISLSIVAEVKAISRAEHFEIYRRQRRYLGSPKTLGMWTENEAALLKQKVDSALAGLAEQAAEDLFQVHDFYAGERQCFATTGTVDARLVWEAFPNEQDRKSDPKAAGRISEVSYDVMVWRTHPFTQKRPDPAVIYEDSDFTVYHVNASVRLLRLTTTENSTDPRGELVDSRPPAKHVLVAEPDREIQLAMNSDYECSIRARFKLDNKIRMTSWSPYASFTAPRVPISAYSKPEQVTGKTFYTQVNIWYQNAGKIYSTNYHRGTLLPIGTRVRIAEVRNGAFHRYVRFGDDDGKSYTLIFQMRHERQHITMWHLFDHYFGTNDPRADGSAFRGLSTAEQENIIAGKVAGGMTKRAVLMAYGYPPSHKTPSLVENYWLYWVNGGQTRLVKFDDNRVVETNNAVNE